MYAALLLTYLLSDSYFHHIGNSITADENPINLFTAINLFCASVVSFTVLIAHIKRGGRSISFFVLWFIISSGLFFAACDEQFEIHEAIGKQLEIAINGTSAELLFYRIFDEGEQPVMISYFAGGLVMAVFFIKKMISSQRTAAFFICALALQGLAALCDSFNVVTAVSGAYSKQINYTGYIEEISEFTSALLFCLAMISEFMWLRIKPSKRK